MTDNRIERLGRRIDPRWDAAQVDASLGELHRRIRRGRRRGLAAVASGVALAAGALVYIAASPPARVARVVSTPPAAAPRVEAGAAAPSATQTPVAPQLVTSRATATPLSADAIVFASDDRSDLVAMRVERGAVRFTVESDPARPFRVDAGAVVVEVLGTEFTIARDAQRATVSVLRGVVRAHWQGGETTLRAGQSGHFPPDDAAEQRRPRPRAAAAGAPASRPDQVADVDALLEAADRAQLDGRMDEALSLIERALERSPDPSHEAATAFTLGRFRGRLGEHERAAHAFARARAADPGGTLAEDALAREVEAWARAGQRPRAREAARLYRERYPDGRRRKMVRQFGLDE